MSQSLKRKARKGGVEPARVERPTLRNNEALALAHELAHPFSLAFALVWAAPALLYQFRREGQITQELAEAPATLVRECRALLRRAPER